MFTFLLQFVWSFSSSLFPFHLFSTVRESTLGNRSVAPFEWISFNGNATSASGFLEYVKKSASNCSCEKKIDRACNAGQRAGRRKVERDCIWSDTYRFTDRWLLRFNDHCLMIFSSFEDILAEAPSAATSLNVFLLMNYHLKKKNDYSCVFAELAVDSKSPKISYLVPGIFGCKRESRSVYIWYGKVMCPPGDRERRKFWLRTMIAWNWICLLVRFDVPNARCVRKHIQMQFRCTSVSPLLSLSLLTIHSATIIKVKVLRA